jgi:methionyl-tRNA formyltransferase
MRVLRVVQGEGSGKPGTVLDDKLTVACGEGAIRIVELQIAGKKAMQAQDFLRGTQLSPGSVIT